jgi:Ca-activated chloride channel homolog
MCHDWGDNIQLPGSAGLDIKMRTMQISVLALAMMIISVPPDAGRSQEVQKPAVSAGSAISVQAGQKFILQLETDLHTRTTKKGDRAEFSTAADVLVDNQIVVPNKSLVRATVTKAKRAGLVAGRSEIQLRFDEIKLADGTVVPLHASITRVGYDPVDPKKEGDPTVKGEPGSGGDVITVAKAGAQGALIGVLTAGPKGALYGSAIGAAVAAAGMIFKRGPDLDLPRNTMFEAKFDRPLDVPAAALLPPPPPAPSAPPIPSMVAAKAEDQISPPRPKLVKIERDEGPPAENPPTSKPPDPPPAAAPAPPAAQPVEPPLGNAGGYKLSVNVRMVMVDTVVRDKIGRNVDNLTRADFLVYEDGVKQEIQSFSRDELPVAVALVIDRSGSEAPYISELRRIANRTLQELKPEDEVALFSFAADVQKIENLTTDRQRIADGLARIRAGGGTDIIDALYEAATYLKKAAPDMRHAIILISDNQATVQPHASETGTIQVALESETVVYSIKTAGESRPLALQLPSLLGGAGSVSKVTQETGGEIIDAGNVASLNAAMGKVISRLRMRYSLGYYPPNPGQGAFHSIVVRLDDRLGKPGQDYFLHARRGYYATADRNR